MTTGAKIGFSTVFKVGSTASPSVFTAIAEVINITGPGLARESVDVTSRDSLEQWREFIPALKDAGEVTITMNFLPGNTTQNLSGLLGQFNADTIRDYQIVFPGGSPTWTFRGFLTAFEPDNPMDTQMSASATFKITGKPTLA
jgi:predicted secreted protein